MFSSYLIKHDLLQNVFSFLKIFFIFFCLLFSFYKAFFFSLRATSSSPLPLFFPPTSNIEESREHKRQPCVLFLDLYLKRTLSGHERRAAPGSSSDLSSSGSVCRLPLK